MNYGEMLAMIQSVSWQGSRLGLERIRELLGRLGDPQKELRVIHVAGTNGKGSVCSMLSSILSEAGYTVGMYTSPHLVSYCERMKINGADIPEEELCALAEAVRPHAEQMGDRPTEFELLTAMALRYFARKHCDVVILEVGLGGLLDATNVIPVPEAAVLMNIGLEHTEFLGNTLAEIAEAKAGIVKEGGSVVAYPGAPEVEETFRAVCARRHAALRFARFDDLRPAGSDLEGQRFSWRQYGGLTIRLLGAHQRSNAVMALETVELLREKGWNIGDSAVRRGLEAARWEARLEKLGSAPLFLLDGAHNPQCARALSDSLRALLPGRKIVFLAGVLADKDYPCILSMMEPMAQEFFCLTPDSERALPARDLADYLNGRGIPARACADAAEGIRAALAAAGEDGAVVTFGSLYMAGAVREAFGPVYRKWLRKEKIRARDSLTAEERERLSREVVQRILASPAFQRARTVMLYRATRGEVRLDALENAPEAGGKRLVYPLCISNTEMIALYPDGEAAWRSGYCGIAEPIRERAEEIPPEEIDLMLCPCTSFDEACSRMGMGGGFYDRYLPRCTGARVAAVAFEVQKARQIPVSPWDRPMELVFTDRAVYRRGEQP